MCFYHVQETGRAKVSHYRPKQYYKNTNNTAELAPKDTHTLATDVNSRSLDDISIQSVGNGSMNAQILGSLQCHCLDDVNPTAVCDVSKGPQDLVHQLANGPSLCGSSADLV